MPRTFTEPEVRVSTSAASLVDRAHDKLHRLITDGDLAEGERIVIDRIAREFGISLIPVREALARLHAEGLVVFERNKGYRVAPRPTLEDLERLFEARMVIEVGAAELAMKRCTPQALRRLKEINRQIARGSYGTRFSDFRAFVTLNERFHVELLALADNPPLAEAYRRLAYHQQITRPMYGRGPGDVRLLVAEHDAIIDALENGDIRELRRAVSVHIAGGYERFQREWSEEAARQNRSGKFTNGHDSGKPPGRSAASPARRKGS